jgi:hypothetical protein
MLVCPVAIAVGCPKCPVFKLCPAKRLLGNYRADVDATQPLPVARKPARAAKARTKGRRKR